MQTDAAATQERPEGDFIARLLQGYRFSVCDHAAAAEVALGIRREVYVNGSGYEIPIPDPYDARSWFLLAEDTETGRPCGSMRLTPRFAGPLEAEEYFELPRALATPKAIEINRFAILPEYRKGKTFLPVVSLGLFKLVHTLLKRIDAQYMIIASKPERVWTYEWMRFRHIGLTAPYGKLDFSEHTLLSYDFRHAPQILEGHPFREFFVSMSYAEVVLPRRIPPLGVGVRPSATVATLRRSA